VQSLKSELFIFAWVILRGDIVMKQAYRGYTNSINNSNGTVLQKKITDSDRR